MITDPGGQAGPRGDTKLAPDSLWSTFKFKRGSSAMTTQMNGDSDAQSHERGPLILVVHDVEETRDGVEALLTADGYRVDAARDEEDTVLRTQRRHPDLILVNLGMAAVEVIAAGRRIRARAELSEEVPVVIFCVASVGEGDEVEIGQNVYVTRPDNFNQLRGLLDRLCARAVPPVPSVCALSDTVAPIRFGPPDSIHTRSLPSLYGRGP